TDAVGGGEAPLQRSGIPLCGERAFPDADGAQDAGVCHPVQEAQHTHAAGPL
ncbi:hypothetical protein EV175_006831, partial [Coemansia sp. RSA 1933]